MPRDTSVADVMAADPVAITAETPIDEAIRLMLEHGFSSLPVVDSSGAFTGFLSDEDVVIEYARLPEPQFVEFLGGIIELPGTLRRFAKGYRKAAAALTRDAMDPEAHTLTADATVEDAATLMVFRHLHRLAIVDGDGKLLGIVSRHDVIRLIGEDMAQ